jgi:hypothetical protein
VAVGGDQGLADIIAGIDNDVINDIISDVISNQESCAGNAGANYRTLIWETDLVDAVNVANGIAIAI